VIHVRDLKPLFTETRSGDDRRTGPRRQDEAALHYAREALVAAACALVEGNGNGHFVDAVLAYRLAEQTIKEPAEAAETAPHARGNGPDAHTPGASGPPSHNERSTA